MTGKFKSIHIDLEKGIFLINDKQEDWISKIKLEANEEGWSLEVEKSEFYEAPIPV